jgi:hypothetical protein
MTTVDEVLDNIPNPDAADLIPYFEPPADEPNPDDREVQ